VWGEKCGERKYGKEAGRNGREKEKDKYIFKTVQF